MKYDKFGILIDCCSAMMTVKKLKEFIDVISDIGYNTLELCINDTYKIDSEEYFGYLLGGYTKEELREINKYASKKGVELIPAIQTLAHQSNLVKIPHYAEIVDVNDILLIDEPKTYALIEKMFAALREGFTTKNVNIGFDEAHLVGLGKYLDKHGYTDRFELLLKHLEKVIKIAEKYGFTAHMWSDMFFRLCNHGDYYGKNIQIPESVIKRVPESVSLAYWDYYSFDEEHYNLMLNSHEEFNREIWFSGGAWTWNGFAPLNGLTLKTMKPAIKQVQKHKVKNVLITLWADDGHECSYFSVLPSLYAIRRYADDDFDENSIKQGFYEKFGVKFDDFMLLDIPNKASSNPNCDKVSCGCKSLLYNDCFLGWKDSALEKETELIPYAEYSDKLRKTALKAGKYNFLFNNLANLCDVLEHKAYLGIKARKAYKNGDKEAIKKLIPEFEKAAKALLVFKESQKQIWYSENKPYGWEIHEVRLGGLYFRICGCKEILTEYLEGKIDEIPELKETILPYAEWGLQYNLYRGLISLHR